MEPASELSFMRTLLITAVLAVFALTSPAHAAETNRYETRAKHHPEGTGKFYMGREIAPVMSAAGIVWLERDEREKEERPAEVLEALALKPGDVAVDLGAGSGYYSFRMAPHVGSTGKVIAVDVSPEMLAFIDRKAKRDGIANVQTVLSTPDDPKLSEDVDVVLMVDVYHELAFPYEVMSKVVASLKPGGRVVLVEYRGEDDAVPIKELHKMTERQIRRELTAVGLQHVQTIGTLPWQHIVVFQRKN